MAKDSGFDPSTRRLCPDGSCLGLVGPSGRCNICGLGGDGKRGPVIPGETFSGAGDGDGDGDSGSGFEAEAAGSGADERAGEESAPGFDPARRLCEDGTCVGVVGPSGACNVCGRVPS
jgi:hypothetical protein